MAMAGMAAAVVARNFLLCMTDVFEETKLHQYRHCLLVKTRQTLIGVGFAKDPFWSVETYFVKFLRRVAGQAFIVAPEMLIIMVPTV